MFLLGLLVWSIACRDHWLVPAAVAVASFLVQSHVGTTVAAAAMVAVAVTALLIDWRRGQAPAFVAVLMTSLAVGIALWLPPLVDQFDGSGNLGDLWHYWTTKHTPTVGYGTAARIVSNQLSLPAPWITRHETFNIHTGGVEPAWHFPFALVLLLAATVVAWMRRDRTAFTLAVVAVTFIGAAFVSVAHVVDVRLPLYRPLDVVRGRARLARGRLDDGRPAADGASAHRAPRRVECRGGDGDRAHDRDDDRHRAFRLPVSRARPSDAHGSTARRSPRPAPHRSRSSCSPLPISPRPRSSRASSSSSPNRASTPASRRRSPTSSAITTQFPPTAPAQRSSSAPTTASQTSARSRKQVDRHLRPSLALGARVLRPHRQTAQPDEHHRPHGVARRAPHRGTPVQRARASLVARRRCSSYLRPESRGDNPGHIRAATNPGDGLRGFLGGVVALSLIVV